MTIQPSKGAPLVLGAGERTRTSAHPANHRQEEEGQPGAAGERAHGPVTTEGARAKKSIGAPPGRWEKNTSNRAQLVTVPTGIPATVDSRRVKKIERRREPDAPAAEITRAKRHDSAEQRPARGVCPRRDGENQDHAKTDPQPGRHHQPAFAGEGAIMAEQSPGIKAKRAEQDVVVEDSGGRDKPPPPARRRRRFPPTA